MSLTPPLDAEDAIRCAAVHAARRGWRQAPTSAVRWQEMVPTPAVYRVRAIPLDAWAVRFVADDRTRLRSSRLVVMDATTGAVLYAGDASDEG